MRYILRLLGLLGFIVAVSWWLLSALNGVIGPVLPLALALASLTALGASMPLDTPKYALKDSAYARCAKAKAEQALAYGIAITSALGLVVAVFGILIWGGHGNPGMFVFGIAMWVTPLLVASTLSNLLDTFWIER